MSAAKPSRRRKHADSGECSSRLNRDFSQKAPNPVRAGDITCLRAGGKWHYLCIAMDLFSRRVISWQLSARADVEPAIACFKKAYGKRNAPCGLMFHSDRGTQYTAFSFRQLLDSLNAVQSFSGKGCPFDNACCECFFKCLKKEENSRRTCRSFNGLQLSLFGYMEGCCNSRRPHAALGMLAPDEMETLYWERHT